LRSRFRPHFGDTGDVVRRVANEHQVIDNLIGPYSITIYHTLYVLLFAVHGIDKFYPLVHKLSQVFIAGGHNRMNILLAGFNGYGANDIIRLYPRYADDRPAQCFYRFMYRGYLYSQISWHGRPVRFIVTKELVSKGAAFCIEYTRHVIRRVI